MTFTKHHRLLGLLFVAAVAAGATACSSTDDTATGATPSAVASASVPSASPSAAADGCPPDVNLMYESLKATPAVFDEIDKSVTGIGEPKCAEGWSTAMTVVKNADPLVVLFRYDPATGKWTPVAVGSDGVCDGAVKVPDAVQAKLHPGC
ncbi:hypothetical protein Cs7R123_51310 [Catellatospora sp. TT07R-123]|uniref:hypothetical protein n=1 Tax=Catellatospora sp. TT07R-123 TaxID=2733863 RepID=UPI001B06D4A5|nr:hypothetical protein [Catellatospora sp. TT07R-123]GHJ47789.1 hypothetical protein Cs7R123_51310 [Catellatospora sp. TT07R-123]